MSATFSDDAGRHDSGGSSQGAAGNVQLWDAVDRIVGSAGIEGIRHHGLGVLAAQRAKRLGVPPNPVLEREERAAALADLAAVTLVRRVRESCEGPLVLFKGPEVAHLYPMNARRYADIDLLTPHADDAQDSMLAAGFVLGEEETEPEHHHLPALFWPTIPLGVEIHHGVKWPERLRGPGLDEILEASSPSRLGIDGVLAPSATHHTLILAAHAWVDRPLGSLRDLIDITVLSAEADEQEIERTAAAWNLTRVWRTTRAAIDGVFFGAPASVPLRSWARQLTEARDRTVLESHLERLLSAYWALPLPSAIANTSRVLQAEVTPEQDESWREKLVRSLTALRHPSMPLNEHHESIGVVPERGLARPDDR